MSEQDVADSTEPAPRDAAPETAPASVYVLLEPLVAGRRVVDATPWATAGAERLRGAGAASVEPTRWTDGRLDAPDGAADVALWLAGFPAEAARDVVGQLRRLVARGGFAVVRVALVALLRGGPGTRTAARAALEQVLLAHFASVTIVEETPFLGVSFVVPGVADVAVNEALADLAGAPSHFVAFCSPTSPAPFELPESLLVPLGYARAGGAAPAGAAPPPDAWAEDLARLREEVTTLRGRLRGLADERDGLREALMTLEDQRDRGDQALSALRRDAERHLRHISETAAALEVATLERERFERRAAEAERAFADATVQLERRATELSSLRDEVARLRAARRDAARIRPAR